MPVTNKTIDRPAASSRGGSVTRASSRTSNLNMRIDNETQNLIAVASAARGLSKTDFVLQSARESATKVILDQSVYWLNDKDWDTLEDALNAEPELNAELVDLLGEKSPWDK